MQPLTCIPTGEHLEDVFSSRAAGLIFCPAAAENVATRHRSGQGTSLAARVTSTNPRSRRPQTCDIWVIVSGALSGAPPISGNPQRIISFFGLESEPSCYLVFCFFFNLHVRASGNRLTVFKWRILNVLYLHLHKSFAPASCFACVSHANMQIPNLLPHLRLGHIYFTIYFYSACLVFRSKVRRQLKSVIWRALYSDCKKRISIPFFKCCIKSRTSFSLKITQSKKKKSTGMWPFSFFHFKKENKQRLRRGRVY